MATRVWKSVFKWLNIDFISFEIVCNNFLSFRALVKKKKFANARQLSWLATT
jgi:hypothetical protein